MLAVIIMRDMWSGLSDLRITTTTNLSLETTVLLKECLSDLSFMVYAVGLPRHPQSGSFVLHRSRESDVANKKFN